MFLQVAASGGVAPAQRECSMAMSRWRSRMGWKPAAAENCNLREILGHVYEDATVAAANQGLISPHIWK
jgi:hypothetical protein